MIELLKVYFRKLVEIDNGDARLIRCSTGRGLGHCRWMIWSVMDNYETWPKTKSHRWLGYVQGLMVEYGIYTLDEVRDQSKGFLDNE